LFSYAVDWIVVNTYSIIWNFKPFSRNNNEYKFIAKFLNTPLGVKEMMKEQMNRGFSKESL